MKLTELEIEELKRLDIRGDKPFRLHELARIYEAMPKLLAERDEQAAEIKRLTALCDEWVLDEMEHQDKEEEKQ